MMFMETTAFTHKDCDNFKSGLCTLCGVAVDPNGPTARGSVYETNKLS